MPEVTAHITNHPVVFFRLHPFDDGRNSKVLHHLDDLFHNQPGALTAAAGNLHQKRPVEFQLVDIQPSQRIQRRVAASEIVHRHPESQLMQLFNPGVELIGIFQRDSFQNFQRNHAGIHLIAAEQPGQLFQIVQREKQGTGLIDRDRTG